MGPGTIYITSTSIRGSARVQCRELFWVKVQEKSNLPPWWERQFLVSLPFFTSEGKKKIKLDPPFPPEICVRSLLICTIIQHWAAAHPNKLLFLRFLEVLCQRSPLISDKNGLVALHFLAFLWSLRKTCALVTLNPIPITAQLPF